MQHVEMECVAQVLVIPDNDPAGQSGYPKIHKNLTAFGMKVDRMDTTPKDFREVFDNGYVKDVNEAIIYLNTRRR